MPLVSFSISSLLSLYRELLLRMERISELLESSSPHLNIRPSSNCDIQNISDLPKVNESAIGTEPVELQLEHKTTHESDIIDSIDLPKLWGAVCGRIRPQLDEQIYAAWFRPLFIKDILFNSTDNKTDITNDGILTGCSIEAEKSRETSGVTIILGTPNKFSRDHIKNSYCRVIKEGFLNFFSTLLEDGIFSGKDSIEIRFEIAELPTNRRTVNKLSAPSNVEQCGINEQCSIKNGQDNSGLSASSGNALNKNFSTSLDIKQLSPVSRKTSINSLNSQSNATGYRADKSAKHDATFNITNLNVNYNFSNFVIGNCNQFAHAACLKVSESPGTSYNPLLIYGGVGLGKTHLANAIGNAASRRKKKVLLASSETFVSELITSLKTNSMDRFKSKFRSLDILIIDDIQFLIGKERTQEEFFHTFNELYGKQKQIIITSDKLPQDLIGLEERLRTRFASGLSVDLQAPDFETRVAILSKKAEANGIGIPSEVARIIANRIDTNVRELEGALTRLQALCSLLGEAPSVEIAQKVIDTIAPSRSRELTTDAIKQAVARQFNVSINDLTGKRRTQNIALARQVAMYLCRKHTARSFPEIGALFGGRDHSTVIHAIKAVNDKLLKVVTPTYPDNEQCRDKELPNQQLREQIESINNILQK